MIPRCKWCDTTFEIAGSFKSCPHCDRACDTNHWDPARGLVVPPMNTCRKCYTIMQRHYR